MRDVSPCDTAHLINNYTNSFACAFHRATAGVTVPNAPGSLNSGLNWGVFPIAKLIFQAAALAWPSLDRVEHNMISFGQILLLDVAFGEMFVPALSTSTSCSAQGATCVVIK